MPESGPSPPRLLSAGRYVNNGSWD